MITITNLFYPPVCGICGKLNEDFLCKKCEKLLEGQAKFEIQKKQNINLYFDKHLYIFQYIRGRFF